MKIETIPTGDLIPYARNAKKHDDSQVAKLAGSIKEFGFNNPVLIDKDNGIIAGHGRIMAAQKLGLDTVPCIRLGHLTDTQRRAYILADNRLAEIGGGWDEEMLALEISELKDEDFDLSLIGFQDFEFAEMLSETAESSEVKNEGGAGSLAAKFGIPPFSVINAREGWWQDRKRAWLSLGIKSEVGRDAACNALGSTFKGSTQSTISSTNTGTSIFDAVLCELAYRWFSPVGGTVLDPFAGGSVRGIVASHCGRQYVGVELRADQVAANKSQSDISIDPHPVWHQGDSRDIDKICADVDADFIFSCPPYADLEVYSSDPADISTLEYEKFRTVYYEIVSKACSRLKNNRFACFVVGEVRDKEGNYYNFVGDTVDAFRSAGLHFYNESILVTPIGTVGMQTSRNFPIGRKLGKTHQNILIFVKGDGKKAAKACGDCDFGEISAEHIDGVKRIYPQLLVTQDLS